MFWPSPVEYACDLEVLDTPRHFAVDESQHKMAFLHCEEAEDDVSACPDTTTVYLTLAPLETSTADSVVIRTRRCVPKVNKDLSTPALGQQWEPR